MKKNLLFIVVMVMCVVGYSQSLSVSKKLHDFGTILEENGIVKHTFTIKNISEKPFIINFISTGCGCTQAQYDKSPIMPNTTRNILIEYDPQNRAGVFRTAINIVGATPREEYSLLVTGNIIAKAKTIVDLYPIVVGKIRIKEDIIPFGIIPNKEKHTYFIELYNHTEKRVKVEVRNSGAENRKTWLTKQEIDASEQSHIMYEIDLSNSDFLGQISDFITIIIDGVEQKHRIKVSATIIPNIYDYTIEQLDNSPVAILSKTQHTIENIDNNNCSYSFEIKNSAKGELKILKAIKKHKAVDYKTSFSSLKEGQKGKITLILDTTQFDKIASGVITFITSSPHSPIFTLTLTGKK